MAYPISDADARHGSQRLSIRAGEVGHRLPAIVVGWLVLLISVTVAVAVFLDGDGARHPALIASVFTAVLVVLGGPLLMHVARDRAQRNVSAS